MRHPETIEDDIYNGTRVFGDRRSVDYREYHRESRKEVMNLSPREFPPRESLWSVARFSLDRHHQERPEIYKADAGRSYMDARGGFQGT
jgi:hypothetical protein